MSRCFPFPPPGYEKKTITDDADLLAKERQKEKRHKKDKKDKHKKEGKEKRDKEEKKEKHGEKKDRKEKHKDKQRDKDKKEKNRDKDKKDKDKSKNNNEVSDEKGVDEGRSDCYNGGNLGRSTQYNLENRDSRVVQELAKRIRNEDGAAGSEMSQNVAVTDHGRARMPGRVAAGGNINQYSAEKEKDKKYVDRKINGSGFHSDLRVLGSSVDNCFPVVDQRRLDASLAPVDKKSFEKQMEGKWKNKSKENDIRGDKSKDRDWENKSKENDRSGRYGVSPEQQRLKHSGKDALVTGVAKQSDIKAGSDSSGGRGNLGKRKELEKNGYIHDNGIRPNKLPKSAASSHTVLENGRKQESSHPAAHFASGKHLLENNGTSSVKGNRINSSVDPQRPGVSSTKPVSSNAQVNKNGAASGRPPHPDLKYLRQVLNIPRIEELADIDNDDQEWLSISNNLQPERFKLNAAGDVSQRVWAEALRIKDADVIALPYVIPY